VLIVLGCLAFYGLLYRKCNTRVVTSNRCVSHTSILNAMASFPMLKIFSVETLLEVLGYKVSGRSFCVSLWKKILLRTGYEAFKNFSSSSERIKSISTKVVSQLCWCLAWPICIPLRVHHHPNMIDQICIIVKYSSLFQVQTNSD